MPFLRRGEGFSGFFIKISSRASGLCVNSKSYPQLSAANYRYLYRQLQGEGSSLRE